MANYNDLITAIDSVIKTNNRREITGQLLQNVLNTMVGSLGENYQLAGFATPTTNPHQPDQNVFYVASQAGVYTQFDNIVLGDGLSFLMWKNGAWTSHTVPAVSQTWVQQNFVSKEWFRKVFRVYDANDLEIVPNDMDSVVDNIKAMVGLWTNQYLSALGMGQDGGGAVQTLAQLNDVQLGTLSNDDVLSYDITTHKWINKQIQTGVDMTVVWGALAGGTNEQINVSHLSDALQGYVTSSDLGTALSSYATQTWVNQNFIKVEWFDKLFQLYNGTETAANKIAPNGALPVDQSQLNIEAMFGFWTKKYISALGQGSDGSAGVGDVTWTLLAAQATDNRTIHLSYITDAVNTYLVANNYITTSAISDMATKTWVNNQGYITGSGSCNYATSAGTAGSTNKVTALADITYGANYLQYNNVHSTSSGNSATAISNPTADWYHHIVMNHGNSGGYFVDMAICFHEDYFYYRRIVNGSTNSWVRVIDSSNIGNQSVSYATTSGTATYANSAGNADTVDGYHASSFASSGHNHDGRYLYWGGNAADAVAMTWGTLTAANGYTILSHFSSSDGGDGGFVNKSGQIFMQIDGYFYQNEGAYRVYDVSGGDMNSGARISFSGGNGYLGNSNNAGWLMVQDMCSQNSAGDGVWSIRTNGNAIFQSVYSNGTITTLSDIRHKEIVEDIKLGVDSIASMRCIVYRKKGEEDNTLYAGSIAQDWQKILPQVVSVANNEEMTLSLQYGVAALIASIITARKVVEHEKRITELESKYKEVIKENQRLNELVNKLMVA